MAPKEIDEVEERIAELQSRLDELQTTLGRLHGTIDLIEPELAEHDVEVIDLRDVHGAINRDPQSAG